LLSGEARQCDDLDSPGRPDHDRKRSKTRDKLGEAERNAVSPDAVVAWKASAIGWKNEKSPETMTRKDERLTINKEFDSFDQFIQEYVTNISRSGAFIKTSTPLPIGSEVTLRFTVVMDDVEVIEGLGEVVRIETDPPGMGVVFKKLSKYSEKLIQKLLSKG
jgi:hypothetical protein